MSDYEFSAHLKWIAKQISNKKAQMEAEEEYRNLAQKYSQYLQLQKELGLE